MILVKSTKIVFKLSEKIYGPVQEPRLWWSQVKESYSKTIVGESFQCATDTQEGDRNRQSNTDRYTDRCRGRQTDTDRHKRLHLTGACDEFQLWKLVVAISCPHKHIISRQFQYLNGNNKQIDKNFIETNPFSSLSLVSLQSASPWNTLRRQIRTISL